MLDHRIPRNQTNSFKCLRRTLRRTHNKTISEIPAATTPTPTTMPMIDEKDRFAARCFEVCSDDDVGIVGADEIGIVGADEIVIVGGTMIVVDE